MTPDQFPVSIIAARRLLARKLSRQFPTANRAEIDDATSHAVEVLLRTAPPHVRNSSKECFLWLRVVASRWLSRELRRKKIFVRIDDLSEKGQSIEQIPDSIRTDEDAAYLILRATIEKIIGSFNTQIIWLRINDGYRLNEIAHKLGISAKAVYHRYNKSIKRLQKFFTPPVNFSKKRDL